MIGPTGRLKRTYSGPYRQIVCRHEGVIRMGLLVSELKAEKNPWTDVDTIIEEGEKKSQNRNPLSDGQGQKVKPFSM
jgi:hypothetical protein